jgi:hypothetical protein
MASSELKTSDARGGSWGGGGKMFPRIGATRIGTVGDRTRDLGRLCLRLQLNHLSSPLRPVLCSEALACPERPSRQHLVCYSLWAAGGSRG